MGFDFGAFAGGLGTGVERGIRITNEIDKFREKQKMRDMLRQSREEAAAAYDNGQSKAAASVEEAPAQAGQPYKSESGAVVSPVKSSSIVATGLAPLASPTDNPDAAGAATAAASQPPPSVSTQTPAAGGEAESKTAIAAPTPQQAAAASTTPTAQQSVSAGGVQPGKFESGGQQFDNRKQAESAAGVRNDPVSRDLFITKQVSQKMQDHFISTGNIDEAEKYAKYAKSKQGEAVNSAWAKVVTATDLDTAAKHARDLYEYVDDGITTTGHKIVTKSDGSQVAVVTMKDKATGKTSEMELTQDKIMQLAGSANPQKMYEDYKAQQLAAGKLRAETTIKREDRAYTRETELLKQEGIDKRDAAREDRRDARDITRGEQREREIVLRDKLRDQIGADGASRYAKTTDPKERAAILDKHYSENDNTYRKMDKPAQEKFIQDKIESYDRVGDNVEATRAKARGEGGKPTTPSSDTVYKNNKTGERFRIIDGKQVPVTTAKPADPAQSALPPTGAGAGRGSAAATAASGLPEPVATPARTKRYIREKKSVRRGSSGGYDYTESPRGMTMDEYKALDEKPQQEAPEYSRGSSKMR